MKCITLWQPWATLMAIGVKTIETRAITVHWAHRHRGLLLIHAAKTWNKDVLHELYQACRLRTHGSDWTLMVNALEEAGYKTLGDLPCGAIVCRVEVQGFRLTKDIRDQITRTERAFGDYSDNRIALMTDRGKLHRFDMPIQFTGKQGIYTVPDTMLP